MYKTLFLYIYPIYLHVHGSIKLLIGNTCWHVNKDNYLDKH